MKFFHIVFLLAVVVALPACKSKNTKKMPTLVETYSKKDKNPFGANIAFRQIEAMYPTTPIKGIKQNFVKTRNHLQDTAALYICIAPKFLVDEMELGAMLQFVKAGNSLFIAAGLIDQALLDKLGCKQVFTAPAMERMLGQMGNTAVTIKELSVKPYGYYYYHFVNHFSGISNKQYQVLGYNQFGKPNFLVFLYGKGKLYLHGEPRTFSNYFLLKDSNFQYLKKALAFTPKQPEHIYWDDYYHRKTSRGNSDNEFSTFSEIMKHPPLQAACMLAALLLVLYILYGGKRQQRIIQQRMPNENTTVTFTETIARLYLQKKDNKNIADKMVTYFNEYIRNTYFLNTNQVNDDFIHALSRKSGLGRSVIDMLYQTISAAQGTAVISDYQLLSLHEQIQQFYTKTGKRYR